MALECQPVFLAQRHNLVLILFYTLCHCIVLPASTELISDDIPFAVHWVSEDNSKTAFTDKSDLTHLERITVTTNNNERYQCILPDISPDKDDGSDQYLGYSAGELIQSLVRLSQCAYRIETYWSYELCYGLSLRQFHEEKQQGTLIVQEYFLGILPDNYHTPVPDPEISYRNIDGQFVPYYAVEMGDGTSCDLKDGEPRRTTVLYICKSDGHNELVSVKEVSTCEYEAVVHSDVLCQNPHYVIEEETKEIICLALDDSPTEPSALLKLKSESRSSSVSRPDSKIFSRVERTEDHNKYVESRRIVQTAGSSVDKTMIQKGDQKRDPSTKNDKLKKPIASSTTKRDFTSQQTLSDFLSGAHCLMGGGKGWWKFEICYGRYVQQFHTDKSGGRTNVILGRWSLKEHVQWISKQSLSSPGMPKTQVSHFYADGDICDDTDKPRHVIVKFKCKPDGGTSISLVLIEHVTCEYHITVESGILCDSISAADDVGMLKTGLV